MNNSPVSKKRLKSEKGVALLMVLAAITLLTAVMVEFLFETKVNKMRIYNKQERVQAKLNAESALELGLARLKVYQELLNQYQKNKSKVESLNIKPSDLKMVYNSPPTIIFPIEIGKDTPLLIKNVIEEFDKNNILEGQLSVEIREQNSKLNVNWLQISNITRDNQRANNNPSSQTRDRNQSDIEQEILNQFKELFEKKLEEAREKDENFNEKYPNTDVLAMINSIRYYISEEDPNQKNDFGGAENLYRDTLPKRALLSSMSELYQIPGLTDNFIDLVKDSLSVYGKKSIDLSTITKDILKLLFPRLIERDITEFFTYKNGDSEAGTDPRPINNESDLKNYLVNTAGVIDESYFQERIQIFKDAGIAFEETGSIFEITARGVYNRIKYELRAIVFIPIEEILNRPERVQPQQNRCPDKDYESQQDPQTGNNICVLTDDARKKSLVTYYLPPRVIDIKVN